MVVVVVALVAVLVILEVVEVVLIAKYISMLTNDFQREYSIPCVTKRTPETKTE